MNAVSAIGSLLGIVLLVAGWLIPNPPLFWIGVVLLAIFAGIFFFFFSDDMDCF